MINNDNLECFLKEVKEQIGDHELIDEIYTDWFHGGEELILKIKSKVQTTIFVTKRYTDNEVKISYLFGHSGLGNKVKKLEKLDVEKTAKVVLEYLNDH